MSKLKIAMVVFPKIEPLDHYGSYRALSRMEQKGKAELKIATRNLEAVDIGHRTIIRPDAVYTDKSQTYDVVIIPGGPGQVDAMYDDDLKEFTRRHYSEGKYICSVCTGALLLGNAGILENKKATTYWKSVDALKLYGCDVQPQGRIVHDGNIITASGVTSGIDLSHYLLKVLFGEHEAKEEILNAQYDPEPIYKCGTPDIADEELVIQSINASKDIQNKRLEQARAYQKLKEKYDSPRLPQP